MVANQRKEMNKEITLGQFVATLAVVMIALIGWGISVEVRITTHKVQIERIYEIKEDIEDIQNIVNSIQIDVATHIGKEPFVTRGQKNEYKSSK